MHDWESLSHVRWDCKYTERHKSTTSFPDPLIESEGMLDRGIQKILDCPVKPR